MTMKAARWHGQRDIRVEEVEIPEVKNGQIKVAVKYAGICGSDLHEYLGGPIFIPVDATHPYSNVQAPLTMGHEFAGEVVEVADDVTDVKVGDRVTIEPILAKNGLVGDYNLDPNLGFVGLASHGGFAEYCVLDAELAHVVPEDMGYDQAALAEPAAVALYAVRESAFRVGNTACVFGCGPIGLMVIDSLKAAGASTIYAVELSPERLAKAEEIGAVPINPEEVDVVEHLREETDGGVDISFEATGVSEVLEQSIECVKQGGECVIVSIWEDQATLQPNEIVTKQKTVRGTIAYRDIFDSVIELMDQGYFSKDVFVTKRIALDDISKEGFEALAEEKSQVKILVSPE